MAVAKVKCGWLSKNSLDRHRPIVMAFCISMLVIWSSMWMAVTSGADVMSADVWGGLAYAIPAEAWALVGIGATATTINGLMKPVKNWMVRIGSSISCVQFTILAYSAAFDGGVFVIALFASNLFLPLNIWLFAEACRSDP